MTKALTTLAFVFAAPAWVDWASECCVRLFGGNFEYWRIAHTVLLLAAYTWLMTWGIQ